MSPPPGHCPRRSLTNRPSTAPSLIPYSSPVQTNVVVSYCHVLTAFIGEGTLLPSLDLNVSKFVKYQFHALCGHAGDHTASVAWVSILQENQFQPITIMLS